MKKKLYPLIFRPVTVERVWGGDHLVKDFGKPWDGPEETPLGESWEIAAIDEEHATIVQNGFLADNSLQDILETYMGELVGDKVFDSYNLWFPLLVKLLDVQEFLSVQVHPDDHTAMERYDSFGKTECWYVMEASEDARIYAGFSRQTTAAEFYAKCKDGTVTELLNCYKPHSGEFFFLPAGTVHACGGGLVIAEIQQASDMTFRLYDWGRENNPATARKMHLEEAIDCIDYRPYDDALLHRTSIDEGRLISGSHFPFNLTALRCNEPRSIDTDNLESCLVWFCTEGAASIQYEEDGRTEEVTLERGQSVLIPADMDDLLIVPRAKDTLLLQADILPLTEESDDYLDKN